MKKFIAILLAAVFAFSVTAFAGEAPAEQAPVSIVFANSNNETTTTGQALVQMLDYIEEQTGGKVTFQRYFGGSICSAAEEYGYLKDGSIQMAAPKPADFASENPYVYGVSINSSWDDVYEYWQYIFKENAETADIINKHTEADGIEIVGALTSGQGCVISAKPFETLDDLKGLKMGCVQSADVWAAMGLNVVNTIPPEMYESLSRGVYDCAGFALSYYLPMSLNEVAPYVMNASEYQTSLTVMVRSDVWDQLTDETKQIFYDAAKLGFDFAVEDANTTEERVSEAAEGYVILDAENAQKMTGLMEKTNMTMLCGLAQEKDGEEGLNDMITITKARTEYSGLDQVPDEYK
ncbi:MAG: TRAP transporter substrate-binding protein DctP [Parasporobacterium sp.]|nr:TRAP transporter substrate-binding protein DctP [Parasporobacterium sp.]